MPRQNNKAVIYHQVKDFPEMNESDHVNEGLKRYTPLYKTRGVHRKEPLHHATKLNTRTHTAEQILALQDSVPDLVII